MKKFSCNLRFVSVLSKNLKRLKSSGGKKKGVAAVEQCVLCISGGKKTLHIDDPCQCQTLDSLNRFSTLGWAKGRRMRGSLSAGREDSAGSGSLLFFPPPNQPCSVSLLPRGRCLLQVLKVGRVLPCISGAGRACAMLAWCVPSTQ